MKKVLFMFILVLVSLVTFSQEKHIQFISTSAALTEYSSVTEDYHVVAATADTFLISTRPTCLHITNVKTLKTAVLVVESQLLTQETNPLSGEFIYYYAAQTQNKQPVVIGYFFTRTGDLFAVSVGGDDLKKIMFYTKLQYVGLK